MEGNVKALPWAARIYVAAIVVLGGICLWLSQTWRFEGFGAPLWQVALFVGLALVAGGKKVSLSRRRENQESGSISLGFAVTLASLLMCGPGVATIATVVGCLSSCLFPKRQPLYQIVFNVSLSSVEAFAGGLTYVAIRPQALIGHALEGFLAVTGTSLAFFAINTLGVAVVIGLCTRAAILKVWKENFLWAAPGYLATGCIAALAMILFNGNFSALVLFVLPVAYLAYQTYVTYTSRAEDNERHIEELQVSQAHLADLYLATIRSLALAIDAKDRYTHQHILRVQRYSVAIATEMGFTGPDLEAIKTGALLHDIGKLGVPEYVLVKPGRLTPEEFDKIKKHPEIGEAILDPVEFPWPVLPIVRHHHEKWDGSGYPDGLKGEEIPLNARIMAVADVYDALTSSRAYRSAWTHERAIETITKDAGTHFDPDVVEAFLRVIGSVVAEMAMNGEGPLAIAAPTQPEAPTKAEQAAQDISKASTELWALYEVAQSLSSSLGTQDTVEFLCRKLERIFPGSLCVVMLRDDQSSVLTAACAAGVNSLFFTGAHTISERSASWTALMSHVTLGGDYDVDDLLICSPEGALWTSLTTSVIVPIVYQEKLLGTINCYHPEPNAFSKHDIHLLEMVAERAAQAVFNSVLFERVRGESLTDPLTDTYTLRYVTDLIETKCNRPADIEGFAVLCLDLDSFRPINENFGHEKGDGLLREVAKIIGAHLGPDDLVARYGGDEFLVLLDGADQDEALAVAEQLEGAIEAYDPQLYHEALGHLRLGISIGSALFPDDGKDCADLISTADSRMTRVKMERKLRSLAEPLGGQDLAA